MISEEQLQEWKCLANEATEGPWFIDDRVVGKEMWVTTGDVENEVPPVAVVTNKKDKFFIAEARTAVPELIAEVRMLRELVDGYKRLALSLTKRVKHLNKEADWLASQLAKFDTCPNEMLEEDVDCFLRCKRHMYTKPCWRAYAKEAVRND